MTTTEPRIGVAAPVVDAVEARKRRSDCGPEGCPVDWLISERVEVDDDPRAFARFALEQGWGDGLPLIPPTESLVREYIQASDLFAEDVLATVPPRNGRLTVEKLAINAVMAGAPPEAMPLLVACVEAMHDPEFNLFAINTTTCSVVPGFFINGPVRHQLEIPFGPGCFGGVAGPAVAIGRAIRLMIRNVGGQVVGVSSKSVFGTPGRVAGIVVGEWEERSPWAPLSERRGARPGNAVTVYGCAGTDDIADIFCANGRELIQIIGRSLAPIGTNSYIGPIGVDEHLVAIAPPWADLIAKEYPSIEDVQERLWHYAAYPVTWWPERHQAKLHEQQRVGADGMVHLVERPEKVLVMVCGGLGNLHAQSCSSFSTTRAVTRSF